MKAYKAFDKDWKCRDYQFEVGKTYVHHGEVKLCPTASEAGRGMGGFHFCEYPLDTFEYYPPTGRFATVDPVDVSPETGDDSKRVAKSITIKAALTVAGIVSAAIEYTASKCEPVNTRHSIGNRSASSATGDRSASSATGYQSASSATGDRSASSATGDRSASSATGNWSASSATGDNAVAAALGLESKAQAGKTGIVVVAWWDGERKRLTTGYIGEDGILADTWYRANESGKLIEA